MKTAAGNVPAARKTGGGARNRLQDGMGQTLMPPVFHPAFAKPSYSFSVSLAKARLPHQNSLNFNELQSEL